MNVFPIIRRSKIFLLAMFFLLTGCIESQPWQSSASTVKPDVGQDTKSIKDVTWDLRADLEKGCSASSCDPGLVCDSEKNICVSCTTDAQCNNGVCDDGVCFECVEHSDCQDVDKARCSDGVCKPCDGSIQCGHFQGNLSCGNAGICECNSDSDCDGGVCDRRPDSAGSCDYTTTPKSQSQCEECISDTQCAGNRLCVAATIDGTSKYFCLLIADTDCSTPFRKSGDLVSLGGETKKFCGPTPTRATCDSFLAYGNSCSSDMECPDTTGICPDKKCTYACITTARPAMLSDCSNGCSGAQAGDLGYCL